MITCPGCFDDPFIEVDELSFAIVDGCLPLQFRDVGDFDAALGPLHADSLKQFLQLVRRPAGGITLRPGRDTR